MLRHATLQQMRLFEAVARHLNYTRAAEEVHLTQPAVSIQVKRFEELVGLPLFETVGKRLYLTHAGELVREGCREILAKLGDLDQQLGELTGVVAGPLYLSVVTTAKYFLPTYLGEFLRLYPGVVPQLKVTNRERVLERMAANQDDLYIVGTLPEVEGLEAHPFLDDRLVFFAHPDHPLTEVHDIPLARLTEELLLSREPGSGIREAVEQHMCAHGVHLTPYMELGSGEAIKQGVMAGLGIGILSDISLKLELEVGRLAVLDVAHMPIRRHWHVIYPQGKRLSLVAERFLHFLLQKGAQEMAQRGSTVPS